MEHPIRGFIFLAICAVALVTWIYYRGFYMRGSARKGTNSPYLIQPLSARRASKSAELGGRPIPVAASRSARSNGRKIR